MEETLVENRACRECGADVRPDTAFCYNCGKSVTEAPDRPPAEEVSSAWFGETISPDEDMREEETDLGEETLVNERIAEPIPAPVIALEAPVVEEPEVVPKNVEEEHDALPADKPALEELDPIHHSMPVETGLKSAASIRKKPKTFRNKEVEVIWEEHGGRSNLAYLLMTLVVVLFTLAVFYFAMQMK